MSDYITKCILFYYNVPKSMCQFVSNILDRIAKTATVPPEAAVEVPTSYNPAKLGRAYYFRPSGCQIRKARPFTIDAERHGSSQATKENCTKIYPHVSGRGMTFLFLWFCPLHHHCYWFHMINGSEGRKDPMQSLYTHLEHSPDALLYNNVCQLCW